MFLLNDLGIGGSERKTVRIVNYLVMQGHEVHLGYLGGKGGKTTLRAQIRADVPLIALERRGRLSWQALRRLAVYMRKWRLERIVCVNLYPLVYGLLASRLAGNCECYAAINTSELPNRKAALAMAVYSRLLRRCDGIVFGSKRQQEAWVRSYGLPGAKCRVIYNGVSLAHFNLENIRLLRESQRATFNIPDDAIVIGTVGQLREEKRQSDLICAAQSLLLKGINIWIVLVGDGPERKKLEREARSRNVSQRVVFAGEIEDVRSLLATFDIFVLTSVAVETFSNAALEAMAAGIPLVLSDIGGAREMIEDNKSGRIFQPGDVRELTTILSELSVSPERRREMARRAGRVVHANFGFERMVADYQFLLSGGDVGDVIHRGVGQ